MKVGIIGAGNMGGAIARGLVNKNTLSASDIVVCDLGVDKLEALAQECKGIKVSTDNIDATRDTDVIVVAVKPWLVGVVLGGIASSIDYSRQTVVSIAAGVTLDELQALTSPQASIFRMIPNTAISVGESMTFISHNKVATAEQIAAVVALFDTLGKASVIEERLMGAATALCSCGIAYAMRYVRAAMQGGVEMGIYSGESKDYVLQTLRGAVALLEATGNNPEVEIDKVTTPGGITIKGLNEMEANGFSNAVIKGLKASNK